MSLKESRSANWVDEEKRLFCNVLEIYMHVLQHKRISKNARNLKGIWDAIHKKFNTLNFQQRTLKQLKTQFKRMTDDARKSHKDKGKISDTGHASNVTPGRTVTEDTNAAKLVQDNNVSHESNGSVLSLIMKAPELETVTLDEDSADCVSNADSEKENEEDWEMVCQHIFGNTIKSISSEKEIPVQPSPAIKLGDLETIQALKPLLVFSKAEGNAPSSKKINENSELSTTDQLKIKEHKRRIEMAEELHKIDLQIRKEKLRAVILEREIMEIRKIKQ